MAPYASITHTGLKVFFLLTALSFSTGRLISQRVIVNANGERIIMFPDGSWRLAEARDSAFIRSGDLQKLDAGVLVRDTMDPELAMSIGERELVLSNQWNDLHFRIKAVEKKVQNDFRKATNEQFSASEIYYNAEANKAMIDPERLARIHEDYENSIQKLKKAKKNQTAIKKLADESKKLATVPVSKLEHRLNKLHTKFNTFMSTYDATYRPPDKMEKPPKAVKDKPIKNRSEDEPGSEVIVRNDPPSATTAGTLLPVGQRKTDYRSAPVVCKFTVDTLEVHTERKRRELKPQVIFSHTDMDLRPYFKDKELIICEGKLSQLDDNIYLHIEFKIASSHSQSNFGSLEKGSLLRLRLLKGETVSLYNLRADKGRVDAYSGHTIFSGQYGLGKEEIKMLKGAELDAVRILWSTGYEDYDVYNVDFIADQLDCLLNH